MRFILAALLILTSYVLCAQKKENEDPIDTSSNTQIERFLKQTSITKKVEFIEVEKVKVLKFQIIVITNLKDGFKIKGLYLSNSGNSGFWTGTPKYGRHAYLDENEIGDLIKFLENCDQKWKKEKPIYQTQYEFETLDNLRITFWTSAPY